MLLSRVIGPTFLRGDFLSSPCWTSLLVLWDLSGRRSLEFQHLISDFPFHPYFKYSLLIYVCCLPVWKSLFYLLQIVKLQVSAEVQNRQFTTCVVRQGMGLGLNCFLDFWGHKTL